jgi:cytochrome b involved in lipid metabolism
MITNKILFSLIGILLTAIVGVGGVSAYDTFVVEKKSSDASLATQPQNLQENTAPVIANTSVRADDDNDDEEDEREDDDDDRGSQTATTNTQTGSAPAPSTSGTAPSSASAAGTYTMAQVAAHNTASSCYTAINGSVYNVTAWIKQHPGGAQAIVSLCGTDGTAAFSGQHGGASRPASELAAFKIGVLAK